MIILAKDFKDGFLCGLIRPEGKAAATDAWKRLKDYLRRTLGD